MYKAEPALLELASVSVQYRLRRRASLRPFGTSMFTAVSDVTLDVQRGETVAIVGESGSGKSTLARAVMGLVRDTSGSIRLEGEERVGASRTVIRTMRPKMQMVFQDPYSSLNPSMMVLDLVAEPLDVHRSLSAEERRAAVVDVLRKVGLDEGHLERFPYEFSGGQRQRIAIARSIVLSPRIVVLDEPVSALDIPTQNQIVQLLEDLRRNFGTAFLIIAHDLSLVRHIADRVAVMYKGRLVEFGTTEAVYSDPKDPYTRALLRSVPYPDPRVQRERRMADKLISRDSDGSSSMRAMGSTPGVDGSPPALKAVIT
ncbi:Oligopeptide transport ATP-binding protein OppF [Hyphomicrobiales bacterium]|nr:Oligopeptide transport ATP-binding protein OppF [Hyphomicrobiales bacterium]CAH1691960.1 Oligopeptide transport ATP-binding protein OppF [Hyphomicrobiales bacterium]